MKNVLAFINLILLIIANIYVFKVYHDTENNPFQKYFNFEEKKKLFTHINSNETPDFKISNNCKKYQDLIMEPQTQKLGDVFKVDLAPINAGSFLMIVFFTYCIFHILFIFISIFLIQLFPDSAIVSPIVKLLKIFNLILKIFSPVYFFIFIILIYKYHSSEIDTYYEFLSCNNINLEGFDKYSSIDILKHDFKRFEVLYIIYLIIGFIYSNIKTEER